MWKKEIEDLIKKLEFISRIEVKKKGKSKKSM